MRTYAIVFVLLVLALSPLSFGATYYVATNGLDTNDGSSGAPWLTLQHAVDTIAAGDTILVQPGTYAGVRIRYSGTSGSLKTLQANGAVLLNAPSSVTQRNSTLEMMQDNNLNPVEYWIVDGFEVTSTLRYGIDTIHAQHSIIRNCTAHNSAISGICTSQGDYLSIENCTSYSNGEHGLYMANSADYGTVRGCLSHNNTGGGLHMNADLSVQPGDGIMTGWTFDKNTIYGNVNGFDADGAELGVWSNNLVYGMTSGGGKCLHFTGADGAINSRSNSAIGNTLILYGGWGSGWSPLDQIVGETQTNPMTGYRIYNNIVFNSAERDIRAAMCLSTATLSDLQSDYNVMTEYVSFDADAYCYAFSYWTGTMHFDQHSTLVHKTDDVNIWVSPSTSDWHLKSGSLAIDKGTVRTECLTDINGLTRPQGLYFDCGCYEYASGVVAVDISPKTLPNATLTVSYSQTLIPGGGVAPYTWSLDGGTLPPGLSFNTSTGVISGTPTALGPYSFTIGLTDTNTPPSHGTQAYTITCVALPVHITTPFMRDGWVGTWYSQNLKQTGGAEPFHYALLSGTLPTGVTLNTSTGEISGTPTTAGQYTFTLQAIDNQTVPYTDQKQFTVNISSGSPSGTFHYVSTMGNNAWPGTVSQPWATLQYAVDNCPAGDTVIVEPGTYVGCRLESSGTAVAPKTLMAETPWGILINSKEPMRAKHGSYLEVEKFGDTIQYWVVDGVEVNGTGASTYGIDVRACTHITVRNCCVHNALRTGIMTGHVDYAWIDNCMTYNNGEHGVYTADSGDYGILSRTTMHHNAGTGQHMNGGVNDGGDGIMSYWTIEKNTVYDNYNGLDADGVEMSIWRNNVSYNNSSKQLHFTGGSGTTDGAINSRNDRVINNTFIGPATGWIPLSVVPTTYSIGNPTGFRIFNNIIYSYIDGYMRGTMCMDSHGLSDFQSDYNLVMNGFALDANNVWMQFPAWQAMGYDLHSTYIGGTDAARRQALWVDSENADDSLKDYHLKAGAVAIDAGTCVAGDVSDDKDGVSRPQGLHWDQGCYEYASGKVALTIESTSLAGGTIDVAYKQTLIGAGGSAPYAWAVSSGTLPNGLSLDTAYGVIDGTPTNTGVSNFTIRLTDSTTPTAQTATQAFSITVTALPLVITTPYLRDGNTGAFYVQHLSAAGGVTPFTWSVTSGSLPTGLSLVGATGVISGTPSATGQFTFNIHVVDSQTSPFTADKQFTVVIGGALAGFNPFYVAASGGSDSNPGTFAQPWATIQYAIDNCPLGGTVIVGPGTYIGFRIENSGTASQPKTVMSETVGAAAINAKHPTRTKHNSYVEAENFSAIVGYWTIDGFTVHGNKDSRYGIDLRNTRHMSVINNIVDNSQYTGILAAFSDYVFVDHNTVTAAGEHAMYVCNSADYGVVSRNLLHDCVGGAIHTNGDLSLGGDGVMTGWLFEKNVAYSCANGYDLDGVEFTTYRNNLSYQCSKGIHVAGNDSAIYSRYDRIINNTLIANTGNFYPLYFWCDGAAYKPLPLGHRVFNNICFTYMNSVGGAPRGSICINSYMTADFQCDYNLVNDVFARDENTITYTFAEWQALGYDVHGVHAVPADDVNIWVDPANATIGSRNFHLKAGSPAIDHGTALTDVVDDMDGMSRPQGSACDIGAYEYAVGGPSAVSVTTASLPSTLTNTGYSQQLAAAGGLSPYKWSVVSGALPGGLGINPYSGLLSGTASAAGTFNFTVRASDSRIPAVYADKALSITTTTGTVYEKTLQNGLNGYAGWQDTWISPDYPTSNFSADTTAWLWYSTPDRQLHKMDLSSIPSGASVNSATVSIYANNAYSSTTYVDLFRCITSWNVSQVTYNNRLTGTAWGAPGLLMGTDFDGSPIGGSGEITAAGWANIDATRLVRSWVSGAYANEGAVLYVVTNNTVPAGGHINTYTSDYTADITLRPKLVVNYTASGGSPVTITTTSLPGGNTGALYNQTLAATGGTQPYSWSIAAGSLPVGLTLTSAGVISGTPGTGGTSNFTVKVLDSVNAVATQALSITVTVAQLQITTSSLPDGTVGTAYSQTVAANGGIQPYTWSLAAGNLPTGLSLVASTGVISGTPSSGGTWSFTAQVVDSQTTPATATKALSITIQTGGQIPVTITTTSLPNGAVGALYSQTVVATGGQLPFNWTVDAGNLPAGLSLVASTGVISGTPTTAASCSFTVKVTDSQVPAATDTKGFAVTINTGAMTYYVDPSGLDTNPGSQAQPWATIQHAVDTIIGGDTVIVNAGTYAGARIRVSGTSIAVKTIRAATAGAAIINTPGALCTKPSDLEVKADNVTDGVGYWVIDGFEVTSSPNYGVEIQYGDHITVQNCKIHASTANNVVMSYSNYCTLENNEVYSNTGGSGMYIGQSGDYCVIHGNSVHNSGSNAMFVTSDSGIGDRILTGWTFEKNKCYSNGVSRLMSADGLVSSLIRNNLSYDQRRAIDFIGQNSATTSNNNRVLNNTLVCTAGGFYVIYIHTATAGLPPGTNNTFLNNILYTYDTGGNRGTFCMDSSAETGLQSDYNVVQNVFALDDNATIMDFAGWKARGHDIHSQQSTDTALFVNPGTFDYHLLETSVAKDGGTTVNDVVDDLEGISRPVDAAYDIGCYEYHTSIPPLSITTSSLPNGQVSVAYNQTVSATGGMTPYTWSIASGSLPAGLSLVTSTGVISGTPTAYGTAGFTIQVVDSETPTPATATRALSIVVTPAPLSITTSSLPNGQTGVSYSQAVAATGGVTPYSWSVASGTLPSGLSLNSGSGVISGTPSATGTSNFTVQVADSQTPTPATATKALSITVTGVPLSVTTMSMPGGTVGTAYSQVLEAEGGTTPYSWSVVSGSLPSGLSLEASTGIVSGTPTASGTSSFTPQVMDAASATATKALSIVVNPATGNTYYVSTTGNDGWPGTESQPWATLQYAVDAISPGDTILVANGIYVGCHITSPGTAAAPKTIRNQGPGRGAIINNRGGNVHNAIMDIDATSYWVIDGLIINGMDSYNYGFFTVLSDHITIKNCVSHGSVSSNFLSGFADYMLNENDEAFTTTQQHGFYNGDSDQYTTERGNLSHDNTGCAFHHNGGLPDGGIGEIRYLLAEKNVAYNNGGAVMNCDGVTDSKFVNNLAYSGHHLGIALYHGEDSLEPSSRNLIYNNTFHNSTAGYDIIQIIDGALDTKIKNNILIQELSSFGSIATDTTSLGSGFESDYNVVVDRFTINNGDTYIPLSTWQGYGWDTHSLISTPTALFVDPVNANYQLKTGSPAIDAGTYVPGVYDDIEGTARPRGNGMDIGCYETPGPLMDLVINTTTLPDAYVGFSYNQQIIAYGGQYPYTWSISSGSLPSGLSIDAAAGVISGTPTATGTSSFTVHIADSQSPADTYDKALAIVTTYAPLSITSTSIPSGQAGIAYAQALTAIGGATPYTWSIASGSLPAGLSLTSSSGLIAGTPTTAGTSSFTARVVDSQVPTQGTVTQALSIIINAAGGGTTYYLSTTGNDAWPGTESQPWATLQYAVDTIAPGDTILVEDGVYTYGCHITISGTSTAVKTVRSRYANHSVIFCRPSYSNPHSSVIDVDTANYWVIDGIVANGMGSYNQAFFLTNANHITIRNCVSHGSIWTNFLSGFCDYLLEENNEAFTTDVQHGFYNGNSNNYTVERGNVSHDNAGCAFHHNGDVSAGGTGMVRYMLTEKNVAYNNGGAVFNCDGVADSKFINNLAYNSNHLGIALYYGDAAGPSSRDVIYNNTFHFTTAGYDCVQVINGALDTKIKNNILIQERTEFGSIATDTTSLGAGFESDYNVVVDRFTVDNGNTYIPLSTWRGYGWDTHSFISTAAALFVDSGNADYHLKVGSPAINAGTTVSEVTTDIEGSARPQGGAYDIGCYEAAGGSALTITTSSLPADTVGMAYNQTLTATGGTTPYTWSLQAGSLPAGLSLVAGTGAITGTPTTPGTASFTAKVTDNVSATATKALSIVVNAAISITTSSLPADTVNIAYNQTLAATGGTGSLTWSVSSGSLPEGLSLVAATGAITGAPTASGASSFTATATDTVGATGTKALSIVVNATPSITTSSLPDGSVGAAYNQTMAATGGTSPLTWSISSGSLPSGLSLVTATGAITGTPTVSGTSNFTAGVTDNVGATATKALSIVVTSTLTITTSSLPATTVGATYNQTLAATGGVTPYAWAISSGSLPGGLSLVAGTGAITGTPTTSGTSNFTARVTDNVSSTATKALSIVVNAAVTITTSSLPADTVGIAYNQTLASTGGTGALTWSISSGSLPAGLSLVAATGAITGTPTTSGTSNFTAMATDTVGASGTKALSITINAAISITTSSLPADTISIAYNQALSATGGTGALTWSLNAGSLPTGLTLTSGGSITGTPTATGTSNFTVKATDTLTASATKALSIVVNAAPSITTSSLPATTVGATYNQTLASTGGTSPLSWSISSGSLPAGLSIVAGTGAITGTPTTSGTSNFTARVTDNVGATATKALSITVNAAITITTSSLPADTVNVAYNQTLAATGGTGALTWSISSGSLPAGLSLAAATGAITGTPTASGTANFTVTATDTVSATGTKALSIVINAAISITTSSLPADTISVAYNQTLAATGGTGSLTWSLNAGTLPAGLSLTSGGSITGTPTATGTSNFTVKATDTVTASATKALSIVVNPAPSITTSSLPATTVGAAYNETLAVTGGTSPLTWSVLSGSLPAGLSLVASTGAITGTPTASGTSSFTARVTDNVGATATKALSIVVNAAITITTSSLPADTVSIAYDQTLTATGGTGALTWSVSSGSLPAGLSLVAATGAITGTPTASGTSSFTAMATDTIGATDTKALSIVINAALTITTASLPDGAVGAAYNQTLASTGGTAPLTWSIASGSLPAGLSLVPSTGAITGTPTASGTSAFTAQVTDNVAATATKALSIAITSSLTITTASLPGGAVNSPYSQALAASGGTMPYTWSIPSGSLPAGLTIDPSSGLISGTPTASGTSNFTAQVADAETPTPATATRALSITISSASGGTYYVSNGGNDSWPGTVGQPWATLQHAVDTIAAGDTILVADGTYVGCYITSDGAAAAVKTLKSQTTNHAVIINQPSAGSPQASPVDIEYTSYWVLDGLVINSMSSCDYGVYVGNSDHITVQNCISHHAVHANFLGGFSDYLLEQNNEAYSATERHGFYNGDSAQYMIERSNLSHDNPSGAFEHTGGSAGGDGTIHYMLTEKNTAWNNSGVVMKCDAVVDSELINNLAYNNHHLGIALYQGDGLVPASRNLIYNNTFHFSNSGYDCIQILTGSVDNKIKNNILVQELAGYGSITTEGTSLGAGFESDYNVVVDRFSVDNGGTYIPLSTWRSTYGWDIHSLISTPSALFVSPGSDYHLKAGSPAINAGATIAQVASDIAGNARPQGAAYDIGCYEYVISALTVTTSSLPNGQIGVAYSQTLSATGGISPYSWTLFTGTLPTGLSLTSGGVISGTPTTSGASSFTVQVTDSQTPTAATATKALSITIPADLVVSTSSLPNAQIGVGYNQTLAAVGGVTPYNWTLASGTLPNGLSLTAGGVISGTPTTSGTSSFTVRVTDAQTPADTATKALSITIPADLSITTASLPGGTVGVAYNQTLAASGGVTPYTWTVNSGSLPAGLTLNSSTGAITGTPTTSGTSNFTVQAADSQTPADSATKALSIVISPAGDATYQYAAADNESSTSSTAWQHKTTLTFTVYTADTYLILAMAEVKENNTSANVRTQVTVDGGVMQNTILYPKTTSDYTTFASAKVVTLSAASHTLYLDYSSSASNRTAYIRNARLVVLRKATLELSSADQGDTGNDLTTTLTNYVTTTFTPATAGDYLLVWTGSFTAATTSYATTVECRLNGTSNNTIVLTNNNSGNRRTFLSANMVNLAASSQTMTIAAAKASGSSAVHHLDRARVIAIRLAGSRFTGYQSAASDTEATTTSTAWQQKLTKSWSVGTAGNWLMLMSCGLADTSTSYNVQMQQQLDNATTEANPLLTTQAAANYMNSGCIDVRNLATGTRTVDVDYRSSSASGTAKIRNVRLIAVPLQ